MPTKSENKLKEELETERYEYRSEGNKPRFFIYAPPLLGKRPSKRSSSPFPPFNNAPTWKTSVYYYWWEYLRRSETYKKTCEAKGKGKLSELYADFGNVFEEKETEQETFWTWWKEHAHLFWEPSARKLERVSELTSPVEDDELVLRIPLELRGTHIINNIRRLLRENAEQVKKARGSSRAKYPVQTRVGLNRLHRYLEAYDAKKANPKMSNHKIADLIGIEVAQEVDGLTIDMLKQEKMDYTGLEYILNRRKTQAVGSLLKAANEYISNVEKGLFPLR